MARLGTVGKPFFLLPHDLVDQTAGHAESVISDNELIAIMDELGYGFLSAHSLIYFFPHRNDAFQLFMDALYQFYDDETNPILLGAQKDANASATPVDERAVPLAYFKLKDCKNGCRLSSMHCTWKRLIDSVR
jgi:hypothetical protein